MEHQFRSYLLCLWPMVGKDNGAKLVLLKFFQQIMKGGAMAAALLYPAAKNFRPSIEIYRGRRVCESTIYRRGNRARRFDHGLPPSWKVARPDSADSR